ncbi:ABC transporter substrate-binding protein [Pseudonocardia nigra]|uniref:ABC transporter substrate-binding protein n=1 Tax=Pseudonocardia nigra TaxID=1921578 RepID=UPI001C5F9476|nr:ABC transporter substrate-binding protein [Pseudonocardia nigra]
MRRLLTLAAVALMGVVTACSGGASAGTGGDPGTLTLAVSKINAGLDPAESLVTSYLRSFGAGESLAKIQPDGTVAPELAESVQQTAPNAWTVVLREGAAFHSGAPVDAAAVQASLERSREHNALAANLLDGVRVSASGVRTLVFETDAPAPFLDFTLAHYELQVHNVAAYEGLTGPAEEADLTGPFRVTGFTSERELTLERNPGWWGAAPTVERIVVRQVTDAQSRVQVALSGQADVVDLLPSDAVAQLEAADGLTLQGAPAANTVAVYLNPASPAAPALADQRVRQALAWAVDRAQVAEIAGEGLSEPAGSWLASNPAYPQADEQGYPRHDPDLAARLLDEAGWVLGPDGRRSSSKDGQPLRFRLQTWGTEQATGEVLQAQWDALGVTVDLSYVDNALVQQARERGDWDAQTAAFTTLGNVPSLMSVQIGEGGSGNYGGYRVPEAQPLIDRANAAATEAERTAAILELNALMAEVVPAIPVHPRPQATAVSDRLSGFVPHPLQYENLVRAGYALAG